MKCYAIVGAKKRGKTTLTRQLVARILQEAPGTPVLVYDKNREWFPGAPLPTMDAFLATVRRHCDTRKGGIAIFEDAGIFFSNTGRSELLQDILTQARHSRVAVFLLFHSLRQLPHYVVEQLDGIQLLKTKDNPSVVERKFGDWPEIYDAYLEVDGDPDFYARQYIEL